MSGGLQPGLKDALVNAVNPPKDRHFVRPFLAESGERPFALLDLAGGTGDIAFAVVEAGGRRHARTPPRDRPSTPHARGRSRRGRPSAAWTSTMRLCRGQCEALLPFADRSYDAVTIAFGHPHVPRIARRFSKPIACCAWAGASSAWSSPPSMCPGSMRSMISTRSM